MPRTPISVIIPHYNRPHLLEEAIASVQAQTCPPAEIIVVDDCSRPEVQSKLLKFKHIAKIHSNPSNLGISETRNIGVSLASNRWVAFLDDDDLYHPRKLEIQSAFLRRHPDCEVLGGPLIRVGPDGAKQIWGYREERQLMLRDALIYTASSTCSMLIHQSAYWRAGGMDSTFRQMGDMEFGIRVLQAGCVMDILPEPLVTYRQGGWDELSSQWAKTCRAHFRIIHKHRQLYRQEFGAFGELKEYARRAQFYGLRKGRLMGRAMWALGCAAQSLIGTTCEQETGVRTSSQPLHKRVA